MNTEDDSIESEAIDGKQASAHGHDSASAVDDDANTENHHNEVNPTAEQQGTEHESDDEANPFAEDAEQITADSSSPEQLIARLDKAEKQAAEHKDALLRSHAELDNVRRRSTKQVEDAHKYATAQLIEALVPVMDSMEMGMTVEGSADDLKQGMELTMRQFESVFEKFNIEQINPLGELFDPELHQAMTMQPSTEHENNHIQAVLQKGYRLNGRLVRPAMVIVTKN